MTELQNYDDKLREKETTIFKLKQTIDTNFDLAKELQDLNEMFKTMNDANSKREKDEKLPTNTRIRHESFDVPTLNESIEPETMPEFMQVLSVKSESFNEIKLLLDKRDTNTERKHRRSSEKEYEDN